MKAKVSVVLMFIVMAILTSGCFFQADVMPNQVGVITYKNEISRVVGMGVYTSWDYWEDLQLINVDTLTFSVDDPEVLTSDNQAVGLKVTIQARRDRSTEAITNILTNWNSLKSDQSLVDTITATAREGMKNGVRNFTLAQLLDDRNGLAGQIAEQLRQDTAKYSAEIINVTVENISVDPNYMSILNEKAALRAETEKEMERQNLIKQQASNDILEAQQKVNIMQEQLKAEEAKTAIEVEIAGREGEKISAANQVYLDNAAAYQIKLLELMADIYGEGTIYIMPEGANLTTFLGMPSGLMPVTPQ